MNLITYPRQTDVVVHFCGQFWRIRRPVLLQDSVVSLGTNVDGGVYLEVNNEVIFAGDGDVTMVLAERGIMHYFVIPLTTTT